MGGVHRECSKLLDAYFLCQQPLCCCAGKSTLLNALLGSMLLPSSNVPETARITRITHTPLAEGQPPRLIYTTATGESREILGEYAIRARPCCCSGAESFDGHSCLAWHRKLPGRIMLCLASRTLCVPPLTRCALRLYVAIAGRHRQDAL